MKVSRTILLLFLLPVGLSILLAVLINYSSIYILKQQHDQNNKSQVEDVLVLIEAAQLSRDMAVAHRAVVYALESAASGRLDEAQLYRLHSHMIDTLAALSTRVDALAQSAQVREIRPQEAQILTEHFTEYRNFVIMSTDMVVVNPSAASKYANKARTHFIDFSDHAYHISSLLAERIQQRNQAGARLFGNFFNRVLLFGLGGMACMALLAVFLARLLGRRLMTVTDALGILARSGANPPQLPQIERMSTGAGKEFREMAQAVLNFRVAIVESKKAEGEIYQLAFYDPLTQLPNRRLLLDRLNKALSLSTRNVQHGALVLLDLDHFKSLNDSRGHDAGDLLLCEVSQRLHHSVRESDTIARLGGDEFIVLLELLSTNAEEAATQTGIIAEKIRNTLNQPCHLGDYIYNTTSSIGIVLFQGHQESADDLLKHADIAMYQAKAAGRNATCFYDPQMQASLQAHINLEADLRLALTKQQFHLYYQIQVDSLRRPLGAEVLLRWEHPERGMVSPMQFIPLAEETGLIVPIGLWVLQTACAQLKAWQHNALACNLSLAVNVSAKQFLQADFVMQVQHTLLENGARPSHLKLELTEGMVLDNVENIIQKMHELKLLGVSFSMDDFGTGYSSLSYLKRLPLDQIKIDQSFVRDIVSDPNDAAIVQTIIAMSDALGLNVIAEGVETEAQRKFLDMHGCHAFQGYLFSKPIPVAQFEALLEQGQQN